MAVRKKANVAERAARSSRQIIGSTRGVKLIFDDAKGRQKLTLQTPAGQTITLDDGAASVEILDTHGQSIKLDASGITITASSKIRLKANQIEVNAELLKIDAGTSRFGGIVQCDSLIANSVVSSSYSPGAGNIW